MCTSMNSACGEQLLHKQKTDISSLNGLICQKCNVAKGEVRLRIKDVYCSGCFLIIATHKFRATLGKSKIVRPDDTILVGHNGQVGSTALLNLIKAGMHESVHKRLVFGVKVIYIDDGLIEGHNTTKRQIKIRKINEQVESLGFPVHGVALSDAMDLEDLSIPQLKNMTCSNDEKDKKLFDIWNKLTDETSRKDFHRKIRNKLMVTVAKILKCQKIFLANDSTSLAVAILSNVSLGRGSQLSSDCGFIDSRYTDVMILRPMRDFNRRELYYYLKLCNGDFVDEKIVSDNMHPSIQKLTDKFVTNLEDQCSGTVSTIVRTGEKIGGTINNKNNYQTITSIKEVCAFCNGCLDTTVHDYCTSSIGATNFSKMISLKSSSGEWDLDKLVPTMPADNPINNVRKYSCCRDCTCGDDNEGNKRDINIKYEEMRQFLCYACQSIFNDNYHFKVLPPYILKSINERIRLKNIVHEIQDFLL